MEELSSLNLWKIPQRWRLCRGKWPRASLAAMPQRSSLACFSLKGHPVGARLAAWRGFASPVPSLCPANEAEQRPLATFLEPEISMFHCHLAIQSGLPPRRAAFDWPGPLEESQKGGSLSRSGIGGPLFVFSPPDPFSLCCPTRAPVEGDGLHTCSPRATSPRRGRKRNCSFKKSSAAFDLHQSAALPLLREVD